MTALEAATRTRIAQAMAIRTAALRHGIDTLARPADVVEAARSTERLASRVVPGGDSDRFLGLVREALAGLEPRIHSTRDARDAIHLLRQGGRLRNVYDYATLTAAQRRMLQTPVKDAIAGRALLELDYGFFGTGTTVYGTVRFAPVEHLPMLDHGGAIRRRALTLAAGPSGYGDVTVVLKPGVMQRATFLPGDSGISHGYRPQAVERLDEVVAERAMTNYGLDRAPLPGGGSTDNVFGRFVSDTELRSSFRQYLTLPRDRAVAALREHLTSTALRRNYIEAQVRWATIDDIEALHIRRPQLTPTALPERVEWVANQRRLQDELAAEARRRGIDVRFDASDLARSSRKRGNASTP